MPVRDAATSVRRAVASILDQTISDWEMVVVDDGSTDGTPAQLRDLAEEEPRLRLIPAPGPGIVAALNAGLAAARAPLIARMDADDESRPDRLATQGEFLARRPEVGVVGSRVVFGGDPQTQAGYALHVAWLNDLLTDDQIRLNRFVESPFAHPSVMFRRELVARHGGYQAGPFPEDYDLWLRWLEAGVRMAKVPEFLLRWNDPLGRLSRTDSRYSAEAFYACKAPYLARWLAQHVAPDRRLLIWGAGRPTRRRAEQLVTHGTRLDGYIDIDPRKIGQRLKRRDVIGPEDLPAPESAFVVGYVAKRGARELIRNCLAGRGWVEGRDFLLAA